MVLINFICPVHGVFTEAVAEDDTRSTARCPTTIEYQLSMPPKSVVCALPSPRAGVCVSPLEGGLPAPKLEPSGSLVKRVRTEPAHFTAIPPVEHYARCTVTVGDLIFEPGVELCPDDDLAQVLGALGDVTRSLADCVASLGRVAALWSFSSLFQQRWPGRAWFIEIHDAMNGNWTQSYQPYGVPRSR